MLAKENKNKENKNEKAQDNKRKDSLKRDILKRRAYSYNMCILLLTIFLFHESFRNTLRGKENICLDALLCIFV
jgi:uncharacterized membrane protein